MTATLSDPTLSTLRKLADKDASGYKWEEGLLLKYQLDKLGQSTKRLCLPEPFREKCLILSHYKFGHRGKCKVAQDIARNFFWPSLWRLTVGHAESVRNTVNPNLDIPQRWNGK